MTKFQMDEEYKIQLNLENFYKIIDTLYSINYTLLCVLNDDRQTLDYNRKRQPLFTNPAIYEKWNNIRIKVYAEIRNDYINKYYDVFKQLTLEPQIQNRQRFLTNLFNHAYSTNLTPNECFNDMYITQENFNNEYINYLGNVNAPTPDNKETLFISYFEYLKTVDLHRETESAKGVFFTLCDEIGTNGYCTLFYGKPNNDQIITIDKSIIDKMNRFANKNLSKSKHLALKYEKSPEMCKQAIQKYELAESLAHKVGRLSSRAKFANKNFESLQTKLKSAFYNTLSGNGITSQNYDFVFNSIYAHSFEIEDILDLMSKFENGAEFASKLIEEILPSENEINPFSL